MPQAKDKNASPGRGRPRAFDRDRALDLALRVFWEKGFDNASLAELTRAMGIRGPSLYAAFGDKRELFRLCLERYHERHGAKLAALARQPGPARQRLGLILETLARDYASADVPHGCFVVLTGLTCCGENQGVADLLRARRQASQALLEALAEEGRQAGELPGDCDVAGLAAFFAACVQGMSVQARDGACEKTLLAVARAALSAWPKPDGADAQPV